VPPTYSQADFDIPFHRAAASSSFNLIHQIRRVSMANEPVISNGEERLEKLAENIEHRLDSWLHSAAASLQVSHFTLFCAETLIKIRYLGYLTGFLELEINRM
ncbi:hypothetical protein AVEN_88021-1, partial [Araneus ventricosus]